MKQVKLRRLAPPDLAAFQSYRTKDVGNYQGWAPLSDGEALEFLEKMYRAGEFLPGHWNQYAIIEIKSGQMIGDVGICTSRDKMKAEIGITLNPRWQGLGLAKSAILIAMQRAFEGTEILEVFAVVDERNISAVRLMERAGMEKVETKQSVFEGQPCRELIFVFSRSDFFTQPPTISRIQE